MPEIERLALAFAGEHATPGRLDCARDLASAEMELRYISVARRGVFLDFLDPPPPSTGDLIRAHTQLQSGAVNSEARSAAERLLVPPDPMRDPAAAARLIRRLFALERYERRAFSRRRSALLALAAVVAGERAGDPPHADHASGGALGRCPGSHLEARNNRPEEQTEAIWPVSVGDGAPALRASAAPFATTNHCPKVGCDHRTPDHAGPTKPAGTFSAGACDAPRDTDPRVRPPAEAREQRPAAAADQCDADETNLAKRTPSDGGGCGGRAYNDDQVATACTSNAACDGQNGDDDLVAKFAFAGLAPELIARRLNLSPEDLRQRYGPTLDHGPDIVIALVTAALAERAIAGDVRAGIFILKARAGWRDTGPARSAQPTPEEAAQKRRLIARVMEMLDNRSRCSDGEP